MAVGRKIKKNVMNILARESWEQDFTALMDEYSMQDLISPLFSGLCAPDIMVRWHSITCFGKVVSRMAEENAAKARVVMRRIMWMLNEESGGCAWGVPEAMGEITASNQLMADEYGRILLSYSHEEPNGPENFLEFTTLLRGAVWGAARLAQDRQQVARQAEDDLIRFLSHPDPVIAGTACWGLGGLRSAKSVKALEALLDNDTIIDIYKNCSLDSVTVGRLAQEALDRISGD
ncbi:DVU0298 family protein [Maridesulfovibrio sp.]|uniref:DVU0298 family protein n=1 Tax=Maridesulfovibrio sp. TaxID=2795000 RepID=UPI002A18CBA3|nr:DVU0298 family protein [Maridesulfovibrio sp.]